ncbi:hypothetical protein RND71_025911 [Anisodus tanguticus]|uniref:Glycosyltransferase 2-like domain-containing protein n=1 Tax=Anisodus tanguticus TaxID=243964 RepID=A0AAE1RMX7_9SOLA|nr:hypothetical protein RND71_025911 [Anisodus tanguticus]
MVPCPHIFDPAEKYISLVIPAYNEEHRLPGALDETLNYLQQRAANDKTFTYEVIIVDYGSTDGTKRVAFEFVKRFSVDNVRVILLGKKHGKGEAIRKGMLHSRGELLLMFDADGATRVDDLEKLENQINAVAKKGQQLEDSTGRDSTIRISDVPAAAFGSQKMVPQFPDERFPYRGSLAAGSGIRDTQCGFKMFTRSAARKLFLNIRLKRSIMSIFNQLEYILLSLLLLEAFFSWSIL